MGKQRIENPESFRQDRGYDFREFGPPLFNPIFPRLFSNLFPLGGGRHVSHPVELDTKIFLHQNFSLGGLRVSIAVFGFEGPGFDSWQNIHFH